jgi:16S rRNA (guanine966-N2)-methyltransferase
MRIVAGNYRGKKLYSPSGEDVRPTSDMARESVFNILRSRLSDFSGIKLLDVFAGTGAFGFEAISRGVSEVCFIDKDIATLKKNAALFDKEKNKINILKADALKLPKASAKYNMVFMDAPYNKGFSEKALAQLVLGGWLADNALIIVETVKNESLSLDDSFKVIDERAYGLAKFTFLSFGIEEGR